MQADFSRTQALSPAVLTTTLLSAHMIIFWLSQDSNVTPPVCLTAFGIYALAAGFEGYAEHPIPHWLRPPIFLTGVFLIWPTGRPSQIAAVVVLAALLALAYKLAPARKKKRVGKEATQGG